MPAPFRIGQGFDVHAFTKDRKLILAGVTIPHNFGLAGHSDADVVYHSVCDAILGAFALGDIGKHFPDNSDEFLNIDSSILLKRVLSLSELSNWHFGNLDITIIAQSPKLAPYIDQMRTNLSTLLNSPIDNISVKATTTEKLGFTGRNEGIACLSSVLFYS